MPPQPATSLAGLFPALLGLALASPLAAAQSPLAASESFVALQPAGAGGGGSPASVSYAAGGSNPTSIAGPLASSESFTASATVLDEGALVSSRPIVAGVSLNTGTKDGGTLVDVFGFGFAEPGAGVTTIDFNGLPSPVVFIVDNLKIGSRTPVGTNEFGNPLGAVDVTLTNALGTSNAVDAYLYAPALTGGDPAKVGGYADLFVHSNPGSFVIVVYGASIPGTSTPIPGLDGALEFSGGYTPLSTFLSSPTGVLGIAVPVPNVPALIGLVVEVQGVTIDAVVPGLAGSFTNKFDLLLQS